MPKPLPVPMVLDNQAEWDEMARDAMNAKIERGQNFTADDIRDVTPVPTNPNWIGRLFLEYSNRGLIKYVGHERSRSRARRGGALARWQPVVSRG